MEQGSAPRSACALPIICGWGLSEWLAVVGGLLEILGFMLVAVELVRAQRRELGTAGPFQFLVDAGRWARYRIRKLFGRTTMHAGSATLRGRATLSGRAKARSETESNDLGERLQVLETNFAALDTEVEQHRTELDQRIEKEAESLRSGLSTLRADVEAKDAEAKEAFKSSATLQWWGIGVFIVGAGFSAAANIVS